VGVDDVADAVDPFLVDAVRRGVAIFVFPVFFLCFFWWVERERGRESVSMRNREREKTKKEDGDRGKKKERRKKRAKENEE
jgi:hypothetical protein